MNHNKENESAVGLISIRIYLGELLEIPWWFSGQESTCNAEDAGSVPGLGWSPGGGNGSTLQYAYLEDSKGRGAWQAADHRIPKELDTT